MSEPKAAGPSDASDASYASDATIAQTPSLYGVALGHGAIVGEYVIEEARARGGFSVVYRATGPTGEPAAVKVLHAALLENEAARRRFEQEVDVIRGLESANVVRIFRCGELSDGRPFVVMEWLGGMTLDEVMRQRGLLPLTAALSIVEQLCEALSEAHDKSVIHRDLKGSNVMLLPEGDGYRVKLLDFGVAKRIDRDTKLTSAGARVGTSKFMAPEQLLGLRISPATDIYSLGLLLFEMLTGRLPFQGGSTAEIEVLHLDALPPRAGDFAPLPDAVSDVIQRCLAKSPAYRYASVEELIADLRAAALDPERQTSSFRTERAMAAGIAMTWTDAAAPAEPVAAALAAVREACEAEGWMTAWAGARSFLAVATLPAREKATRELMARAIRLALNVTAGASERTALSARVHVARVVVLFVQSMPQIVGGALLDMVNTPAAPAGTVLATDEALAGIEAELDIAPGPPGDGAHTVLGAKADVAPS